MRPIPDRPSAFGPFTIHGFHIIGLLPTAGFLDIGAPDGAPGWAGVIPVGVIPVGVILGGVTPDGYRPITREEAMQLTGEG
jgi:hypothetical protein